jgi:hypothetical protein
MTDARLRDLYREVLEARDARPGGACPEPDALQALVEREGTEEERLAMIDHVASCRSCSREFELLRALRAVAPAGRRPRVASPWLVAASAIVAVAAATMAIRSMSTPTNVMRGPSAGGVILLSQPAHSVLQWHAVPRAVSYVVEVLDAQDTVLAADTTADTSFALPARLRARPGTNKQWWVRARLSDGAELRSPITPVAPR